MSVPFPGPDDEEEESSRSRLITHLSPVFSRKKESTNKNPISPLHINTIQKPPAPLPPPTLPTHDCGATHPTPPPPANEQARSFFSLVPLVAKPSSSTLLSSTSPAPSGPPTEYSHMRTRRATPVAAASGGRVAAILRHKKKVMAPRRRYRVQPPRAAEAGPAKRRRLAWDADDRSGGVAAVDSFDALPDDLILCILRRLSSTASTPSDLLSVQMTCKRLRALALHPLVLCRASPKSLAVPANKWSEAPHLLLRRCAEAGNLDASYMLGMIRFYCLGNRPGGMSLLARAAMRQHAPSLYSLAVIQFNGSGSFLKSSKNLRAGVLLCARAASLGHVDALRELGHCLQDGYGVRRDFAKGRRFLVQANAREIAAALRGIPNGFARLLEARKQHQNQNQLQGQQQQQQYPQQQPEGLLPPLLPLLSDFGWNLLPALQVHPANQFLTGWFALSGGAVGGLAGSEDLRMCSHLSCGRPETRRHEFRRCSICGKANYCSRACQALDWRLRHKGECVPIQQWVPVEVQVQVEFHPQPPQQVQIPADSGPANDDGAYAAAG